jgi:N-methylhydantoinase A
VTINAVLERKGARTGLITTKGFRDVYEIGRGNRPEGYNLFFKRPVPLVPRDLRLEVDERLYATGEVLTSLDEQSAATTIGALEKAGVESVAVCFLHAYAMLPMSSAWEKCCASSFLRLMFRYRTKFSASFASTSGRRRRC